jgi:hypothetical protein
LALLSSATSASESRLRKLRPSSPLISQHQSQLRDAGMQSKLASRALVERALLRSSLRRRSRTRLGAGAGIVDPHAKRRRSARPLLADDHHPARVVEEVGGPGTPRGAGSRPGDSVHQARKSESDQERHDDRRATVHSLNRSGNAQRTPSAA